MTKPNDTSGVPGLRPSLLAPGQLQSDSAASKVAGAGGDGDVTPETPPALRPSLGQFPTTPTWYYQTVAITDVAGEVGADEEVPVEYSARPVPLLGAECGGPMLGVALRQAQTWKAAGLALGNLLHSVCLAPGEITQVAIVDWQRTESGSQEESVASDTKQSDSSKQARSIAEITRSAVRETQEGESRSVSDSSSTQAGVGGALSFLAGSASRASNHTVATAVTRTSGQRDLSAAANQNVTATTARVAEEARSRRAAVVREVRQEEHEQVTTRVVANYNRCHTLNIEYFEVVEVFRLTTDVVSARRCVFLPMELVDFVRDLGQSAEVEFGQRLCIRFRPALIEAAEAVGDRGLAIGLRALRDGLEGDVQTRLTDSDEVEKGRLEGELEEARLELRTCKEDLKEEVERLSKAKMVLADTIADLQAWLSRPSFDELLDPKDNNVFRRLHAINRIRREGAVEREGYVEKQKRFVADLTQRMRRIGEDVTRAASVERNARERLEHMLDALRKASDSSDVAGLLMERQLYYSQAIWLALEPGAIKSMVKGTGFEGESLDRGLDPHPIAIEGRYLGFYWDQEKAGDRAEFEARFRGAAQDSEGVGVEASIAIPTGGVFAEGVLGQARSAEKLDSSLFWKWDEHEIPIKPAGIESIRMRSRAQDVDLAGQRMETPGVSLPSAQPLPDYAGLGGALGAVTSGSIFRDMSGSDIVKSLAEESVRLSSEGAKDAAQKANDALKAMLEHQQAIVKELAPLVASAIEKKMGGGGASSGTPDIPSPEGGGEG